MMAGFGALLALAAPAVQAQPVRGAAVSIEAGAGRVVQIPRPAGAVFAADPKVAEVRPASPTSLFVFGVGPGRTTIAAVDTEGLPVVQMEVTVRPSTYAAGEAQALLRRMLPGRTLRVEPRGNGLGIEGEVRSAQEAEQALGAVRNFVSDGQPIDNRLRVAADTQVNLRVRIAEVGRDVTRQLGIDWQALGTVGRFGIAAFTQNSLADLVNLPSTLALGYRGAVDFNAIIDALAQDRLITVLAEPNLTALSGETASFLVGGEFPIPVNQRDNVISIQFKQYGISLAFVPTVGSQGRISLRVRPEVSELSELGAVRLTAGNSSLQIPALTVRRAETTVEVGSGQSFAIAGLLQDNSRTVGRALPAIGEVPVLGALFRSSRFQRNETELVIVVTPYLVRPVGTPEAVRLPTDGFVPAVSDADRGLLFRQRARERGETPQRVPGDAGFVLN